MKKRFINAVAAFALCAALAGCAAPPEATVRVMPTAEPTPQPTAPPQRAIPAELAPTSAFYSTEYTRKYPNAILPFRNKDYLYGLMDMNGTVLFEPAFKCYALSCSDEIRELWGEQPINLLRMLDEAQAGMLYSKWQWTDTYVRPSESYLLLPFAGDLIGPFPGDISYVDENYVYCSGYEPVDGYYKSEIYYVVERYADLYGIKAGGEEDCKSVSMCFRLDDMSLAYKSEGDYMRVLPDGSVFGRDADERLYIDSAEGKREYLCAEDEQGQMHGGSYLVYPKGQWGNVRRIVDSGTGASAPLEVDFEYVLSIHSYQKFLSGKIADGRWCVLAPDGRVMLPLANREYALSEDGFALAREGNRWLLYDLNDNGKLIYDADHPELFARMENCGGGLLAYIETDAERIIDVVNGTSFELDEDCSFYQMYGPLLIIQKGDYGAVAVYTREGEQLTGWHDYTDNNFDIAAPNTIMMSKYTANMDSDMYVYDLEGNLQFVFEKGTLSKINDVFFYAYKGQASGIVDRNGEWVYRAIEYSKLID